MKRRLRPLPSIGSVSSATMRPEDLIPSFVWELKHLRGGSKFRSLIREANALQYEDDSAGFPGPYYANADEASEVLSDLFDALDSLALPYMYFGATEGDGADYGFWVSWDSIQEDSDVLRVAGEEDLPKGYLGYFAIVNDHGNVTFCSKSKGHKSRVLWDCV